MARLLDLGFDRFRRAARQGHGQRRRRCMARVNKNAERGRASREQLVDVATRLFAARGYEATSIEAVLQETGMSRGSLYHHFAGKDALFSAVLERLETRIGADVTAATKDAGDAA